jgi:hypothetical protein
MAERQITPREAVPAVLEVLREQRGEWMTPVQIWEQIRATEPALAGRIEQRVAAYKNPARNDATWFVSNTFTYLKRFPNFQVGPDPTTPVQPGQRSWPVARACDPEGPADLFEPRADTA